MNIPKGLKDLVLECGECEKEHRKYSEFMASWSLTITQTIVDKYAETDTERLAWQPFVGLHVVAYGMWDDSYGSEVDSWSVFREQEQETEQYKDFWRLMSHLNSEDNDMAFEFSQKYFKPEVSYVEIKDPVKPGAPLLPATKAMADGGLRDE